MARETSRDRRERVAEMQAAQKKAERRRLFVVIGACVAVVAIIGAAVAWAIIGEQNKKDEALANISGDVAAASCDPVTNDPASGSSDHVGPGTNQADVTKIQYATVPPSSGKHFAAPAVDSPPRLHGRRRAPQIETLVHNLEHGYTILWYDRSVEKEQAASFQALATKVNAMKESAQQVPHQPVGPLLRRLPRRQEVRPVALVGRRRPVDRQGRRTRWVTASCAAASTRRSSRTSSRSTRGARPPSPAPPEPAPAACHRLPRLPTAVPPRLVGRGRVNLPTWRSPASTSPAPATGSRKQVETIERTGTTDSVDIMGLPVVLLTMRGAKTGAIRKVPLMRVEHDGVLRRGGEPGRSPGAPAVVPQPPGPPRHRPPGRHRDVPGARARARGQGARRVVAALRHRLPALRRVPDEDGPAHPGLRPRAPLRPEPVGPGADAVRR